MKHFHRLAEDLPGAMLWLDVLPLAAFGQRKCKCSGCQAGGGFSSWRSGGCGRLGLPL